MADRGQAAGAGLITRLGALLLAPRSLARRDLARKDGQAGDDLLLCALLALALGGSARVVRAGMALAAGRSGAALGAIAQVFSPAIVFVGLWVSATLLYKLFCWKLPERAVGELGARVATGLVLASLAIAPLAGRLPSGTLRQGVEAVPWALAAWLFGVMLTVALDPVAVEPGEQPWSPPRHARLSGVLLMLVLTASGAMLALSGWRRAESEGEYLARVGAVAPAVDQPLLDGGDRLVLAALRGRPVVLSFWATWCGPCLQELPVLERVYRARGAEAPLVYLVNVDDPDAGREAAVRAVIRRLGLTMPVVLDDGAAGRAYAITKIPSLARIDATGGLVDLVERPLDEGGLRRFLRP